MSPSSMKKERILIALGHDQVDVKEMARRLDMPLKSIFKATKRLGVSVRQKPTAKAKRK
jgi:transcriptional regulator with GAF, ATPase, and Fis domain